jgi:hypothetical protein
MAHLAVALLSEVAMWRDPVLCDCVDQIEPSLSGAWGGATTEERFAIGVARVAGKAAGTVAEHRVRDVLVRAGVVDWNLFVATSVVPNAGPYAASVATFRSRNHYRWVPPGDLPAPHNPFRLPGHLRSSWERQQVITRLPWPMRRDPRWVRNRWVLRHRDELGRGALSPLASTDWGQVMAAVAQFDAHRTWTPDAVDEFAAGLAPTLARGFVASLRDPIVCDIKLSQLGNGQHRALTMLAQGVPEVLVCDL